MSQNDTQAEAYSMIDFASRIWSKRARAFAVGVLFMAATAVYIIAHPAPYTVQAMLRIDPGIPMVATATHIADVNIESEVSLLRSRTLVGEAVDEVLEKQPALLRTLIASQHSWRRWVGLPEKPQSGALVKQRLVNDLQSRLTIKSIGHREKSGLVGIALATANPDFGKPFLQALIDLYTQKAYERNVVGKTQGLKRVEADAAVMAEKVTIAEAALREYEEQHDTLDLQEETRLILNQMADVERQLILLTSKKAGQTIYYTDNFPALAATSNQMAYLQHQREQLKSRVEAFPEMKQRLFALKREATSLQDSLRLINQKVIELRNEILGISGFATVTDNPQIFREKGLANALNLLLASFVGGSAVGVIFVHLFYFSPFARIRSTRQLQEATSLPVLGMLYPIRNRLMKKFELFLERPNQSNTATELFDDFRIFKRNLDFATFGAPNGIMLFTCSANEQQEIGFITSHIASFYAQDQKTILVDCNMLRDAQNPYYQGTQEPGLSHIITKATALETSIQKLNKPNLWYLPCGEPTAYGTRLLDNGGFIKTLALLQQVYDRVILNYPPIRTREDFGEACQLAGSVFFVMNSSENRTRLRKYFAQFEGLKNIKGLVVKDVPANSFVATNSSYA